MKRAGFGPRRTRLARSTKPLPKVNPARQAKRRTSYAKKLAAYKRSATYKAVEERAQGRCEAIVSPEPWSTTKFAPFRCTITRADGAELQHHHVKYARLGGNELPEDIQVLCAFHHQQEEAKHPTRTRDYRRPRTSEPL